MAIGLSKKEVYQDLHEVLLGSNIVTHLNGLDLTQKRIFGKKGLKRFWY